MSICNTIVQKRKELGISQIELGNKLNVSQDVVVKWENGNESPNIEKLTEMSLIFGMTIEDLVNGCANNIKKNKRFECEDTKYIRSYILRIFTVVSIFCMIIFAFGMTTFIFNSTIFNENFDGAIHYFAVCLSGGAVLGFVVTVIASIIYICFIKKKKNK